MEGTSKNFSKKKMEKAEGNGEIEESLPQTAANPQPQSSVKAKVAEVEVRLYRQGKGPIAIFKSNLGGWTQDQLEVGEILHKYGFKSVYAFNPGSGRGVSIRIHPRNGRSLLPYQDGSIIFIDGEPKDSPIKPVSKILLGVAILTLMITYVLKEPPEFVKKLSISGSNFPPWVLACAVIVFTRMRKRTKDMLKKYGYWK